MSTTVKKITFSSLLTLAFFALFLALPSASHAMSNGGLKLKKEVVTSASATKPVVIKDLSCVQGAVLAREKAITASWTTFNTAMVSALTKRTDGLVAAWKVTDEADRSKDLKAVLTTWKTGSKNAHTTLKTDRKAAWASFRTTMKVDCKLTKLPKEDAEPKDAAGAVTL